MPNLNYTHDVMFLSSNYMKRQHLPEAISHHAAVVGVCNNASKTQVISALINAIVFDVEPLGGVEKSKYLGSMFVANGHSSEEITPAPSC